MSGLKRLFSSAKDQAQGSQRFTGIKPADGDNKRRKPAGRRAANVHQLGGVNTPLSPGTY